MKIVFTSKFLPNLQNHLYSLGRKQKNTFIVFRIFLLFFVLTKLLPAQNINNKNELDIYKDLYTWKEKENTSLTEDSILTVLGRWAWGPCLAVDADSNFSYIGNGPTFHVLDISDPSRPEIVGEYLTDGYVYDIELRDKFAFVCIGRGLLILDVSKPALPEKISEISLSGIAISFALGDSFAYVTTFSGVMWLVDISDLLNPYVRNSTSAGGQIAFCVEAKNGYVYLGNPEFPPLVIVDATNPDTLSRIEFEIGGWGYCAFIKDTLLFLGVHGYTGRYFKIYNVSNQALPEFVGQLDMALDDIMAITVSEDDLTAFIRTQSGRMISVDISDLTQPVIIDEIDNIVTFDFGGTGISISRSTILAAYYNGLAVVDVSQPDSLKLKEFFPTGGFAEKIQVIDTIAFLASGLSGLWILDVSNPAKPKPITNINTGGFTADLVVEDSLLYIVNWAAYSEKDTLMGLWIIDISDIYSPKILSYHKGIARYATSYIHPNSIDKSENLVFITQSDGSINDSTLEIIDISNPVNPKTMGVFRTSYSPYNVDISDTVAFLATADGGVRIIDISNPENPIEISTILNAAFSVCIKGQFLYASTATFSIIDINDIYNPFVVSSFNTHSSSSSIDLFVSGKYAYWAEGSLGLVDVSDPKNLTQVTTFEGKDFGRGVFAIGDKIYFADQTQGIWVLRNNLITSVQEDGSHFIPNSIELSQNYPNPFNPSTLIEFKIPQKEKVLIEIFNLLGQRVKTLLNEELESGLHKIEFNASGLSSGIYFFKVITKDFATTKKMVLLR